MMKTTRTMMSRLNQLVGFALIAVGMSGCGEPNPYGIAYNNTTSTDLFVDATSGGDRVGPGSLGGGCKEGRLGATLFPITINGNKVHLKARAKARDGQYSVPFFEKDVEITDRVIADAQSKKGYVQIEIEDGGKIVVHAMAP